MKIYLNVSEKYGGLWEGILQDYQALNPSAQFVEKDDALYERNFFGDGSLDFQEEIVGILSE